MDRPRLAIVGCGDIARRLYLPTLAAMAAEVELVACCDTDRARACAAVAASAGWAPRVRPARDVLEVADALDGVICLTPPAAHADVVAARYREEWLPHAAWVVLDGVGHAPQLDVPLEAAELIAGFTS